MPAETVEEYEETTEVVDIVDSDGDEPAKTTAKKPRAEKSVCHFAMCMFRSYCKHMFFR